MKAGFQFLGCRTTCVVLPVKKNSDHSNTFEHLQVLQPSLHGTKTSKQCFIENFGLKHCKYIRRGSVFVLSTPYRFSPPHPLHEQDRVRHGVLLEQPDNCKQLEKWVAPASPSGGLLVHNLIGTHVKTFNSWEKQDVLMRSNLNSNPVSVTIVCLIACVPLEKKEIAHEQVRKMGGKS